jgi:hypothetical protein
MITREVVKSEIDLVEERYLEVLRNIIQQFQLLPTALLSVPTVPTETDSQLSLMDKLLSVKLSGPPDLAENFDAYLNEEKRIEE